MAARLILARHGNTFRPEDTPVWVGARSDMPLVEKGLTQAQALADMLRNNNLMPDMIIAGPLQRTRQTAQIVADHLHIPSDKICIDKRLTEIDYGPWEGKSTTDIISMGGQDQLKAWDKNSLYPSDIGWSPSEAQITVDIGSLIDETTQGTKLLITSNGILRFFARVALNAADFPDRKVATGNVCVMERTAQGWHITKWNQKPEFLNHNNA